VAPRLSHRAIVNQLEDETSRCVSRPGGTIVEVFHQASLEVIGFANVDP
jgi:hypothetical protein